MVDVFNTSANMLAKEYEWNSEQHNYYKSIYPSYLKSIGFFYIGRGCSRQTYGRAFKRNLFDKNKKPETNAVVVKIPLSEFGVMDNFIESLAYKRYRNAATADQKKSVYDNEKKLFLTPCHLMSNHCLMMKFVEAIDYGRPIPSWGLQLDGRQIGMYNGRHVAYDYGHDAIIERREMYLKFTNQTY